MINYDALPLIEILERAKGKCWIIGREPKKERDTICIRISEEDRQRLVNALMPWWKRMFKRSSAR